MGCDAGNLELADSEGYTVIAQIIANHFDVPTYAFAANTLFTGKREHIITGKGYDFNKHTFNGEKPCWMRPATAQGEMKRYDPSS